MKKTYIIPNTIVVNLSMTMPLATSMSGYDEVGSGQLTKEYTDEGSSTGSTNTWDDEW